MKAMSFMTETDDDINDQIDAAYLTTAAMADAFNPMVAPEARTTTIKLVPRSTTFL
jgi:hypothetical protein